MDSPANERPSLLLADDDRVFASVLAKALEQRGFSVETAHDGEQAAQVIRGSAPEFAVVDLRLPDVSGLKLVQMLKAADPNTRIVVLTGYGSIATAIEAVKLGAVHYLTKPATVDQILKAFEHVEPDVGVPVANKPLSVDRLEWEHIQRVLAAFDGNISATARELNMHRRTLQRKLSKHPPRA